ncbi:hypothetical protein KAI54_04205, partial [Candidatus Gracilibacteria bacterium]|nr:hypothetical protein [Candidatus Gracilibacteria bacterium]
MQKTFHGFIAGIAVLALLLNFSPIATAEPVGGSLNFPMTIWGLLVNGAEDVPTGAVVDFINDGQTIGSLTTTVAGEFGGDSAYDMNIALSEFTNNLTFQITINGSIYTLDAGDLIADSENPDACPPASAISFVSQTC